MGIQLNEEQSDAPTWIELHSGAALMCAPPNAMRVAIANADADRLIVALAEGGEAVTKAGGTIDGIPDLTDPEELKATHHNLAMLSLAERATCDWRGILDEKGKPRPFNAVLLAHLFLDHRVVQEFTARYLKPLHETISEGNVSRPLPSGTTGRAGGKSTAKGASSRAPRAPRRARKTARTRKTHH